MIKITMSIKEFETENYIYTNFSSYCNYIRMYVDEFAKKFANVFSYEYIFMQMDLVEFPIYCEDLR